MAARLDPASKLGELSLSDNEGRSHLVRFGGAPAAGRSPTDITFELDPAAPAQLGLRLPRLRSAALEVVGDRAVFSSAAIDVEIYSRAGDEQLQSELQVDLLLKTRAAALAAATIEFDLPGHEAFEFVKIEPFVEVSSAMKRGKRWVYSYDRAAYLADPKNVAPGIGRQEWHQGGYQVKHRAWKNHRQNRNYCIISRPKLIAADGAERWGTVSYNEATGQLEYRFDAAFLATAALPVRVDPTFGDTTAGPDTFPMSSDRALACAFSLTEDADALTMYMYIDSSGTDFVKALVFTDSAGTPATLTKTSAAVAVPTTPSWASVALTGTLTAATWHLGSVSQDFTAEWYKDASGGNDTHMANGTLSYSSPGNWPGTDGTYGGQLNHYIEYTAGSAPITAVAADSITLSDSAVSTTERLAAGTDTLTLSDSAVSITERLATASDTLTLTDSAVSVSQRLATASDTITLTDSAEGAVGFPAVAADTITLSDSAVALTDRVAAASDTLTLTDSAVSTRDAVAAASDTLTLTDSAAALVDLVAAATDSISLTDSAVATVVAAGVAVAVDTLTLTDSADALTTRVAEAVDSITLTDSAVAIGPTPPTPPVVAASNPGGGVGGGKRLALKERLTLRELELVARLAGQNIADLAPELLRDVQDELQPDAGTPAAVKPARAPRADLAPALADALRDLRGPAAPLLPPRMPQDRPPAIAAPREDEEQLVQLFIEQRTAIIAAVAQKLLARIQGKKP